MTVHLEGRNLHGVSLLDALSVLTPEQLVAWDAYLQAGGDVPTDRVTLVWVAVHVEICVRPTVHGVTDFWRYYRGRVGDPRNVESARHVVTGEQRAAYERLAARYRVARGA